MWLSHVMIFLLFFILSINSLSLDCLSSILGLLEDKVTLLKVIDAFGKPVGALRGSFTSLGDFEECLDISGMRYNLVEGALVVDTGDLSYKLPSALGTCVPDVCSEEDVGELVLQGIELLKGALPGDSGLTSKSEVGFETDIAKTIFQYLYMEEFNFGYNVSLVRAFSKTTWSAGSISVLVFIGILVGVCVVATVLEYFFGDRQLETKIDTVLVTSSSSETLADDPELGASDEPLIIRRRNYVATPSSFFLWKLLSCFALQNTLPRLFKRKTKKYPELGILNVYKSVSIWWIILGSLFKAILDIAPVDLQNVADMAKNSSIMVFVNALLAVDTFLFVSAFLFTYLTLSDERATRNFNYIWHVVCRYIRVVPLYALSLMIWYLLFPVMGSGPLWFKQVDRVYDTCSKNLWTNLLMINNFVPNDINEICMQWSWFISLDFQLYTILPIFVLCFTRASCCKAFGTLFLSAGIFLGVFISFFISMMYDVPAVLIDETAKESPVFLQAYFQKPYCHLSISLLGAAFAILCIKFRNSGKKFSYGCISLMQLLGIGLVFATVYLPFEVDEATTFVHALYNLFSRLTWPLGLGLFSLSSIVNPHRTHFVSSFSSWNGWTLFSKLTFGAYLSHLIIIHIFFGSTLRESPFRVTSLVLSFGGILWWCYIIAGLGFLLVEAPVKNIIDAIMKNK